MILVKKILFFILCIFFINSYENNAVAQPVDSTADTIKLVNDSASQALINNTPKTAKPLPVSPKKYQNDAGAFYFLVALLLALGLLHYFGGNFFKNLFKLFTNTTQPIRQLRELVNQNKLLNILMNAFACVIFGIYLYLLVLFFGAHNATIQHTPSIILVLSAIFFFVIIIGLQYLFLKFIGSTFGVSAITDEYIFNISIVNKILSIILIPFIILMAFGSTAVIKFTIVFSFLIILLAFANRFFRSQNILAGMIRMNRFHFFIYLCASEILPIALFGKFIYQQLF